MLVLSGMVAAPDVMAGLGRNQVSHLRLAGGQLQVQRPGHLVDGGACVGLMQLTAELALRWGPGEPCRPKR